MFKRANVTLIAILMLLIISNTLNNPAEAKEPSMIGTYNGHAMEIAAGLELKANHHFSYGLSYGALDEEAAGTWTISGDELVLKSDPIVPPRFILVSQGQAKDGKLSVHLDVPKGMSPQYFDALITLTSGETERNQFSEDGTISPNNKTPPVNIRVLLPIFSVASEPVKLDANSGTSLSFRFEPHDLGKVAFENTPLKINGETLLLVRHGRTIEFKR